jgi:hypothetical protein
MDLDAVHHLRRQQDGLVSRRQLHAPGLTPGDVERLQRRRELTRLLPGVYLDHTGRPNWTQRAWAGVLHDEPAALVAASALRAAGLESPPGADRLIAIGVAEDRRVRAVAGYGVVRMSRLEQRVRWTSSPPRQLSEDALLDLAGATADELDGRMFHDGPRDWDADLERELDAAVAGGCGLRLGWGQVFRRPCRTALAVGSILRSRGWSGRLTGCGEACPVTARTRRP